MKDLEKQKIKQQERLLIEISKEFKKALSSSGKSEEDLKQYLNKNEAFITGLKNGFGDLKMRELADVFTFFNKKVVFKIVELDEK